MNDPFDREQIFWFNGWHLLRIFLPVAVLAGISFALDPQPWRDKPASEYMAWCAGLALFIVGGSLFLRRRYFLRLSPDGLEMHYPNRTQRYAWDEVSEFRVLVRTVFLMPAAAQIIFDFVEDSPERTIGTRIAGKVLGYETSILAMFNVSARQLSEILNAWRERYGVSSSTQD